SSSFELWNLSGGAAFSFFNNTLTNTSLSLLQFAQPAWTLKDNIFDHCTFGVVADDPLYINSYNAYATCTGDRPPSNGGDVTTLSQIPYQHGPLGDFYLPGTLTQLIDA